MVLNIKDFPDEIHRQAKIQAAILSIPLRELVIKAIEKYLENKKEG